MTATDIYNMAENYPRDVQDALWYLGELVESVEIIAKREGYQLPQCFPHAKRAWMTYFVNAARRDEKE